MSRRRRVAAGGVLAVVLLLLCACRAQPAPEIAPAHPLLLPGFAAEQADISELRIIAAGNTPAVTLVKRDGRWRVPQREDWLADPALVDGLLESLVQLHGAEPKTDDPALYPRLGVAAITDRHSRGLELQVRGGAAPRRLLVGIDHAASKNTYVRVEGQARTWLSDRQVSLPRDPEDWLDRSLVDLPAARIDKIEIVPVDSPRFVIERANDGYVLGTDGTTQPAQTETAQSLAGLLSPLVLQDLARDDNTRPERELHFHGVDGLVVHVQAWRREGKIWLRVSASTDAARARAWAVQTGPAGTPDPAGIRADAINTRNRGYIFLLPPYPSSILMLGREQLRMDKQ